MQKLTQINPLRRFICSSQKKSGLILNAKINRKTDWIIAFQFYLLVSYSSDECLFQISPKIIINVVVVKKVRHLTYFFKPRPNFFLTFYSLFITNFALGWSSHNMSVNNKNNSYTKQFNLEQSVLNTCVHKSGNYLRKTSSGGSYKQFQIGEGKLFSSEALLCSWVIIGSLCNQTSYHDIVWLLQHTHL